MAGILAMLVDEREERLRENKGARKTELLLADAGLSIEDIAAVMGKKYDAVRMTISRSRFKEA
jgi:DNA-directed RNA polymerase specialized sigma24 family protein